jgi:FKBP-type peptidyl-prolyl cis-trans isomerase FkpA
VFDSSYGRREPLKFRLGSRQVIQGLEEGVARMRKGGRATLIIPSALAYGDQQAGPIPPFATLIFEVWLVGTEE